MCVCTNPEEYEFIFFAAQSTVSLQKAGVHLHKASTLGDRRHSLTVPPRGQLQKAAAAQLDSGKVIYPSLISSIWNV